MADIKWDDAPKPGGIKWDTPAAVTTPAPDPTPDTYDDHITTAAQKHGLDPKLLKAVGYKETRLGTGAGYDRNTQRGDGGHGYGMFQLDDRTAGREAMLPKVAADPAYAADVAASMLSNLLKQYGGDKRKALAAYNAGSPTQQGMAYADEVLGYEPKMTLRERTRAVAQGHGIQWDHKPQSGGWGDSGHDGARPQGDVARTPLEQFGAGITTVTQSLPGALAEGRVGDLKHMVVDEHNPAKAKEEFGFLSPAMLKRGAKNGSHFAKFLLDNPRVIAPGQLVADLFDPALNLTGKGIGKVASSLLVPGFKYVAGTSAGAYLLNAFSPLRSITQSGGQEAKRAMQALLVKVSSAPAQAQHTAIKIFSGLDRRAQEDVVHTFQKQHEAVQTTDPYTLGLIQERAKLLQDYQNYLTSGQVQAGTLKAGTAEANPLHFGMAGAYKNEKHSDEINALLDELRGSGHGGTVTSEGTERAQAQFKTLHEGQTQAKVPLRDDFNVVSQLERTGTHALKNIAFEDGASKLPTTLVQTGVKVAKGTGPVDGAGKEMIHFSDLPQTLRDQFEFSPSLKNA